MHLSAYKLNKKNAIIKNLFANLFKKKTFKKTLDDILDDCIARNVLEIERFKPDVIIGSSFGAMVTTFLVALGHWAGKTILLCPATYSVFWIFGETEKYNMNVVRSGFEGFPRSSLRI